MPELNKPKLDGLPQYRRRQRRVRGFLAVMAMLCLLCLAGCRDRSPLTIGFVASLSGPNRQLGVDGRNAVELFVQELNRSGGVRGRPVQLVSFDLESNPALAEAATQAMLDAGVLAVVGYFTSTEAAAALPFANEHRLPLISPAATADEFSGIDDYFFRTVMSSRRDALALHAEMGRQDQERLLVLASTSNPAYVRTYTEPLAGLSQLVHIAFFDTPASLDYSSLPDPQTYDAVLIIAGSIDTGGVAQGLANRGLHKPLYGSGWAANDELVHYGGMAVEGMICAHQINPQLPAVAEFSRLYLSVYGSPPGFGAIEAWDSMLFLHTALQGYRGRREDFRTALRRIHSFQGISGTIQLDAYGDAERQLYFKQVLAGRLVVTGTYGD